MFPTVIARAVANAENPLAKRSKNEATKDGVNSGMPTRSQYWVFDAPKL